MDKFAHIVEESILDRLVRIETRIVKIMEALHLDPRTGSPLTAKEYAAKQARNTKPMHERSRYD